MKFQDLSAKFPATDIEWRISRTGMNGQKPWAKCLAYITNRAIMQRLDDVCGPENWKNEYQTGPSGGVLCGISIHTGNGWVTKWDGAENTKIESVKGGLSDAMKRAAVQWGIGRYLYHLPEGFAQTKTDRVPGWRFGVHKLKDKPDVTFFWAPPALPVWALPETNNDKLHEFYQLCEQSDTDIGTIYKAFGVTDSPTEAQLDSMNEKLKEKISKSFSPSTNE